MNISITFRHMDATDAVKTYATEKVGRLQRFLRTPLKGQVTLSCQHETSEDMYASIDKVIDKIERQIEAAKTSISARKKGAERAAAHLRFDPAGD
jgi:putative sigma-54 modulation protein